VKTCRREASPLAGFFCRDSDTPRGFIVSNYTSEAKILVVVSGSRFRGVSFLKDSSAIAAHPVFSPRAWN
jgi:hypothetical protein